MTASPIQTTPFDTWILLPENADKRYELIGGEIVEKMVSSQKPSRIAGKIYFYIQRYLSQHKIGRLTPPDGGYHVGSDRYIPDVGYISKARQPTPNEDVYNPLAPDLVVEVVSPTDTPKAMRLKVANYRAAETIAWVVTPDDQEIEIYIAGQPARLLGINDTLDGGDVLPGFTLAVKQIFEEE